MGSEGCLVKWHTFPLFLCALSPKLVSWDAVTWQFCDSVICCLAVGGLCAVWLGLQCTPSRLNSALCPKLHPTHLHFTCCHSPGRLDRANYIAQIILISVHKYEFTGHKCRGRALPRNLASVASFAKKQILVPLLLFFSLMPRRSLAVDSASSSELW